MGTKIFTFCFTLFLLTTHSFAQIGGYTLNFDGTNDYVAFSSANSPVYNNSTITIEAWINSTSTASEEEIVSWGTTGTSNVVEFRMNSGKLQFGMDVGAWSVVTSTASINTGNWVHIAVTKSGNTVKLYVNGKLDATGTITATPSVNQMTIANVFQNGSYHSSRYEFPGKIDEVRIWNIVRTEAEIKANMFKEIGTNANLIGYYKMSDGSGTTLTDNSGNGKNGTLTNGPLWKASGCFAGSRQALDFDGTNDYVSLPSGFGTAFNGLQHFSFCGWVYHTNLNTDTWGTYFTRSKFTATTNRVTLHQLPSSSAYGSDDIMFGVGVDPNWLDAYTTSNVLELNKWIHLAVVFDGTQSTNEEKIKIFVNGKQETLTFSGNPVTTLGDNSDYNYLAFYNSNEFFKGGKFDEFSFWNVSLTENQIREIMFRTLSGDESGLISYYRFDQTDGTILYDMTANGYNGTLTNMDAATDWVSSSASNTWIGSESSTWSTAANWSSSSVPVSTDNVGIYKWTAGNDCSISGTPTVNSFLFSSTASPTLGSNFTVNGNLLLEKNIDLNGQTITIGNNGYLIEGSHYLYGTSGEIRIEKNWGTLTNHNAGGLGLTITSTADLGTRTIIRGHTEQSGNGNKSILRYYRIIEEAKVNNNSLAGKINDKGNSEFTIQFAYLDNELNGLNENTLTLFKSTDNGTTWSLEGGTLNTTNNTVMKSEITNLDGTIWTLADTDSPIPVELTSFVANVIGKKVVLNWKTETEVNNSGFEIERATTLKNTNLNVYKRIGFVQGHGNSNLPNEYSFIDYNTQYGKVKYRLKQIDTDGTFFYSNEIEVNIDVPKEFALFQNYPNPFNPSTVIDYTLPQAGLVTLKVYNVLGKEVATLVNEQQEAGRYNIELNATKLGINSGVYFYTLEAGNFKSTKKMIIMK